MAGETSRIKPLDVLADLVSPGADSTELTAIITNASGGTQTPETKRLSDLVYPGASPATLASEMTAVLAGTPNNTGRRLADLISPGVDSTALALILNGGVPAPWYNPSSLEIDLQNNRFAINGVEYATEAELFTAIGNAYTPSINGNFHTVGGYVDAGQTNLVIDGTMPDGTDKWVADGSATVLATGGELQVTGPGNGVQSVPVQLGHAYRLVGKVRRGTGATAGIKVAAGPASNLSTPTTQGGLAPSSSFATATLFTTTVGTQESLYVGGVNQSTPGFCAMDDFEVKETWPYSGYSVGSISGIIRGVAPADTSGTKVLLSFYPNTQNIGGVLRNYIIIAVISGRLRLQVFYESTSGTATQRANLDLGAITAAQALKVQFAITLNLVAAVRDDGAPVTANLTTMLGVSHFRLHATQDSSTNFWDNGNTWLTLFNTFTLPPGVSLGQIAVHGDSYASGYPGPLAALSGKAIVNFAQGGSTIDLILSKIQAATTAQRALPTAICDGDDNGYIDVATYLSKWQQIKDLITGPIVVLPTVRREIVGTADNNDRTLIQQGLATMFPGPKCFDLQAALAAAATPPGDNTYVANNWVPKSLLNADQVHLNTAGSNIAVNGIWTNLQAQGVS